jgi:hypothetical protein
MSLLTQRKTIENYCRTAKPVSKHYFTFQEVLKLSSAIFLLIISFSILFLLWRLIETNYVLYELRGFNFITFEWWFAPELWVLVVLSIVAAALIIRSMDARFAKEYIAITGISVLVFIISNSFFISSEIKNSINAQQLLENLPHRKMVETLYEKNLSENSEMISVVNSVEEGSTITIKDSDNAFSLKNISPELVNQLSPGKRIWLKYEDNLLRQVRVLQ